MVTATEHLRKVRIKKLEQLVQFPSWEARREVSDLILLMAKSRISLIPWFFSPNDFSESRWMAHNQFG